MLFAKVIFINAKIFLFLLAVDSILAFMKITSAKTQKIKIIKLQIYKFTEPVICKWLGHFFLLMSQLSWLNHVWDKRSVARFGIFIPNRDFGALFGRKKNHLGSGLFLGCSKISFGLLWSYTENLLNFSFLGANLIFFFSIL